MIAWILTIVILAAPDSHGQISVIYRYNFKTEAACLAEGASDLRTVPDIIGFNCSHGAAIELP